MKNTKLILIIILLLCSITGHSQYSWLNPLPQGNTLNSVFFTDEHRGYAVGNYGTVLKTVDSGISWSILNTNITKNLNGVFFINSNYGFVVGDSGVIIMTFNSGTNWTTLSSGINDNLYSIFFTDSLHGYSCGRNGKIIKTSNGGYHWDVCASNVTTDLFSIDFPSKNTGYVVGGGGMAGGNGYVLKSSNGGVDWILLDSLAESFYSTDFTDSLTGYAAGNFSYIVKTEDGGNSWIHLNNPNSYHIHAIKFINSQIGFTCDIVGGIMKTENGGQSWISLNSSADNSLFSVNKINDSTICVVGAGGIILVSDNGGNNFSNSQNGTIKNLYAINKANNNCIYITGDGTLFKTSDGGLNWEKNSVSELAYCISSYFENSFTGYALTSYGIYKTTDSGLTWAKVNKSSKGATMFNIYMVNASLGFAVGVVTSPGGFTSGILLKTTDGTHWISVASPSEYALNKTFFKNNTKGYLVGNKGKLYTSDNAGNTWSLIPLSVSNDLKDIVFTNENTGYILGNNYWLGNVIIKTVDGGLNWYSVYQDNNMGFQNAFQSFYFLDSLTGYVVGTSGYISKTNDGGISWVNQKGFTDNSLNSILLINDSSGYIIGDLGTFSSFGNVGINVPETDSILSHTIYSYPNPFNEKIQFELYSNREDEISIELFDIDGRLVYKINRIIVKGKQTISFTPTINLNSGTFIYIIKGKEIFNTGKIIKEKQ